MQQLLLAPCQNLTPLLSFYPAPPSPLSAKAGNISGLFWQHVVISIFLFQQFLLVLLSYHYPYYKYLGSASYGYEYSLALL